MGRGTVGLPGNAEEMTTFFDTRAAEYEAHMRENIEGFNAFYDSVVAALPASRRPRILDLGIGTGLELDRLFARFPSARVTGIDVSRGMLDTLTAKVRPWSRRVRTIHASFLDEDLGRVAYDAVLSVMAFHHWVPNVKVDLYRRIHRTLIPGGVFVNADYVATNEESARRLAAYRTSDLDDRHTRHIDLPLTIETELQLLAEAGFAASAVPFRQDHCATFVSHTPKKNTGPPGRQLLLHSRELPSTKDPPKAQHECSAQRLRARCVLSRAGPW